MDRMLADYSELDFGSGTRNHGLITGWKFLCVLSSFVETIVV